MSTDPAPPTAQRTRRPRLRGTERDRLRSHLTIAYRAGASIRLLAIEHDLSYGLTRTLLLEEGVDLRGHGSSRKAAGQ